VFIKGKMKRAAVIVTRLGSLTLREERRQRVFLNRVLRRIFVTKRDEDRSWRKLHIDELHNLYPSPNIVRVLKSRRMRWAGRGMHGGGERCLQGFGWCSVKAQGQLYLYLAFRKNL